MRNVKAVISAAGEGTRMDSPLSKLIHHVCYQSLVEFPARACIETGIGETIIVVRHQGDKIRGILGEKFTYVYQKKRLGTGDALRQAIPLLRSFRGESVVLPGDAPFITSSVLIELIHQHRKRRPAATVVTALLSDQGIYPLKRIVLSSI